ncbi:MAG: aminodeoxychorismate synthase component I [Candidatus Glassbacteria bacterium]|nr:aminodeoxychorismate synthase component I [Candidatus Glassbacteria bacterium]
MHNFSLTTVREKSRMYHQLPIAELEPLLAAEETYVLLDTSRPDGDNTRSSLFLRPARVIRADGCSEVPAALEQAQLEARRGHWVAGTLSYEMGYALEERLSSCAPAGADRLLWLGVFDRPYVFDHRTGCWDSRLPEVTGRAGGWEVRGVRMETGRCDFLRNVQRAKEYIRLGETYQLNYTTRYRFDFHGCPVAFYRSLRESQGVPYSGLLREGGRWVLCLSPELFFRLDPQRNLITRPMKGTAARGLTPGQDSRNARALRTDAKNRAENLMIVDLLRNDLGQVCRTGSVAVPAMFEVERYDTLLQMTSTVAGRLKQGVGFAALIKAAFPSGSVTGAPKLRTMEILSGLEAGPRGIYTGSLGCLAPDGSACFNVAIRTVELEGGRGVLGVGGAVVADSSPAGEYDECGLKASFLTGLKKRGRGPEFDLFETMLFDGSGIPLLELHLDRLRDSARYFSRPFSRRAARRLLEAELDSLGGKGDCRLYRVRLRLDRRGELQVSWSPVSVLKGVQRVAIYGSSTDPGDRFLYHKTTNRRLYDKALEQARSRGLFDYIFTNLRGQVTEGSITNIYAESGGVLYTPPVRAGLLPGVYRRWLRRSGQWRVRERILYPEDLHDAERLWASNALHGLLEVRLVPLDK